MTQFTSTQVELLDGSLTLIEFCTYSQLPKQLVIDMIDAGVLEPLGVPQTELNDCRLANRDLRRARIAQRLMDDLSINIDGAAMIIDLLEERDELHRRVALLEKMLEL
jgi:chaperone modulatory protein CbpM